MYTIMFVNFFFYKYITKLDTTTIHGEISPQKIRRLYSTAEPNSK